MFSKTWKFYENLNILEFFLQYAGEMVWTGAEIFANQAVLRIRIRIRNFSPDPNPNKNTYLNPAF
jgi:hypothetical protein